LIDNAVSKLIAGADVLHCDKVSWFGHIGHIEASALGFALWALIVSGDNGLSCSNS
jgi:hypothetical protein